MLNKIYKPLFIAGTTVFLMAACSVASKQDVAESKPETTAEKPLAPKQDIVAMAAKTGMADDLYFNLIAAELAGQYDDFDNAANAYQQALNLSQSDVVSKEDQYKIARRAWEIGRYTKNTELADQAAQAWQVQDNSFTPRLARVVAAEGAPADKQLQVLSEVLDLVPAMRSAFAVVLAKHYSESPDVDAGLQMVERWLEQYENDADLLKAGAVIAEDNQRHSMAYQWWYRLASVAPGADEVFNAQGHAAANLRLLGEAEEAAERLRGLHALQPETHWITLEYGRALLQSKQYKEGLGVMEGLAAELNTNPEVLHITGFAAFVAKDYGKAAEYFKQSLAKGYSDHESRYWIGHSYVKNKEPKEAVVWLSTLAQGKHWSRAQHLIGDSLAQMEEWDDFEKHFDSLRSAEPDEAGRWYMAQCQSLIDVKLYERAVGYIHKAVEADPKDMEIRYQRGVLLGELGYFEEATSDLRLVVSDDPEHAEAMNALGYMLIDSLGDTAQGVPLVKRALELRPESAPIMDSYGWGLLLDGEIDEAVFWLEKAWSIQKDHEIGAHLGEALWLKKRFQQARSVWAEAQKMPRGRRADKVLQAYERLGIEAD